MFNFGKLNYMCVAKKKQTKKNHEKQGWKIILILWMIMPIY